MDIQRQKTGVALLSVLSNATLVLFKIIVGIATGSVSIISEAIHSGVDLVAAVIALFAVRSAGKPADDEHPFGHGKIENISGTIEALLIFLAAGWIIYEAIHKLFKPEPLDEVGLGVVVMLASAVMNMIVSHMLFKVGKATDSIALQADAWHLRTDVWTSAGVMTGLIAIMVVEKLVPGLHVHWIDPVAAMAVALLIIKAAYELTVESGRDLLDVSLTDKEEKWISDYISSYSPRARAFHHLRTRKAGSHRFVEFHLRVAAEMSVAESHDIAEQITSGIRDRFPGTSVTVHVEPCNVKCTPQCSNDCLISEADRKMLKKGALK